MRSRSCFFCALALFAAGFLAFSGIFTDSASAAVSLPSGGHYLTQSEALQIFGSTISCTYFDGSDYQDDVFTYDTMRSVMSVSDSDLPISVDENVLVYTAHLAADQNPQYVTFKLNPQYSVFDTEYLYCCCGLSSGYSVSSQAYNSPSWKWFGGGSEVIFSGSYVDNNGDRRSCGIWLNDWHTSGASCTAVPAVFDFNGSTSSCYSVDCQFRGNSSYGTDYYFFISLPYVSGDAFGSSGTIGSSGTSGTGGSGSGGGETDLTETNGLISGVISALQNLGNTIVNGIKNLFVPDEEYMEAYHEDMQDLLEDHLGGVYQAVEEVKNFVTGMVTVTPASSMPVPRVTIPLLGNDSITVGGWTLSLLVQDGGDGFTALYNGIKLLTDFIVATAFLMMLKRKLYVFLAPDSEVISE